MLEKLSRSGRVVVLAAVNDKTQIKLHLHTDDTTTTFSVPNMTCEIATFKKEVCVWEISRGARSTGRRAMLRFE